MPTGTGISVFNPSLEPRREHVIHGTDAPTPCTFWQGPNGECLNVALVDVGANSHENVDAIKEPKGGFQLHPAVSQAFVTDGAKIIINIGGIRTEFSHTQRIIDHNRIKVDRWMARDKPTGASRGTGVLITTMFHLQPTVNFRLWFEHENLTAQAASIPTMSLTVEGATNLRRLVIYDGDPTKLLVGVTLKDCQGPNWHGAMLFETPEMKANRTTNIEAITQTAQESYPMRCGLVERKAWGLWKAAPVKLSQSQLDADLNALKNEGANASNPMAHLGVITNMDPSGTGAQPEFGANIYAGQIGAMDARGLELTVRAVGRHGCRPTWFTEANGEILDPEQNKYPEARVWSEGIHWAQNPTNRFRRADGRGMQGGGWMPHDIEHDSKTALADAFLASGDFLLWYMLKAIQPVMACHTLEHSGLSEGRSVGRWFQGAAQCYRATGVSTALKHGVDMWPIIWQHWNNHTTSAAPFRPYSWRQGPDFGWPAGTWGWVTWQDSIMLCGLDAALIVDPNSEIFTGAVRSQMEEVRLALCRAIVNVAFAPAHGTFKNGELFTTGILFGQEAKPKIELLSPNDYLDTARVGRGNINVAWGYWAVPIAKRVDPSLAVKCDAITTIHVPQMMLHNPGGNARREATFNYLGTA